MKIRYLIPLMIILLLTACSGGGEDKSAYVSISQEEALRIMEEEEGYIILDVRTFEEYESGHISGAICIPNETIDSEQPEELPDLNQTILVYCRSGNRSKQASDKLAAMGYTAIYEFGGINSWAGAIIEGDEPGALPGAGSAGN